MHRPGFTIIECLVAVGILGVLFALSVVGLRGIRDSARHTASLSNVRQCAAAFSLYSADNADFFPFFTDGCGRNGELIIGGYMIIGVRYFDAHKTWHVVLADAYLNGKLFADVFQTPRARGPRAVEDADYLYGCAFIARPGFWNPRTRTGPTQFGPTTMASVTFPASKTLLSENPARLASPDTRVVAAALVDGSAWMAPRRRWLMGYPRGDGPPYINDGAVHFTDQPWSLHTLDGVYGRDFE